MKEEKRLPRCQEIIEKFCEHCKNFYTEQCPELSIGKYVVRDGIENRSDFFCKEHGEKNNGN